MCPGWRCPCGSPGLLNAGTRGMVRLCSPQASPPLKHSFLLLSVTAAGTKHRGRFWRWQGTGSHTPAQLTSGRDCLAWLQNLLFLVSLNSGQFWPSPTHLKGTRACLCFFLKVCSHSVPRSGRCVHIPGYSSGRGDHCPCGI